MDLAKWSSQKQSNYEVKVLRDLLKALGLTFNQISGLARAAGPEFGLHWFSENYPSFPMSLEGRKLRGDVTISQLFKGPSSRCEFWSVYEEVCQNWAESNRFVGLAFDRMGDAVEDLLIHNAPNGIFNHGPVHFRIEVEGGSRVLIVQRLADFYKAVAASKITLFQE